MEFHRSTHPRCGSHDLATLRSRVVSQRASQAAPARGAPLRLSRRATRRTRWLSCSLAPMAAQTDPHDDRQLGLVGGVIGAGHGVWCSEGHGQGQMQAQIAIARLTIAYQKDLILWIGRKKRAIAVRMVTGRPGLRLHSKIPVKDRRAGRAHPQWPRSTAPARISIARPRAWQRGGSCASGCRWRA
jgi:hypothetical protein